MTHTFCIDIQLSTPKRAIPHFPYAKPQNIIAFLFNLLPYLHSVQFSVMTSVVLRFTWPAGNWYLFYISLLLKSSIFCDFIAVVKDVINIEDIILHQRCKI